MSGAGGVFLGLGAHCLLSLPGPSSVQVGFPLLPPAISLTVGAIRSPWVMCVVRGAGRSSPWDMRSGVLCALRGCGVSGENCKMDHY